VAKLKGDKLKINYKIFKEEATSTSTGFHHDRIGLWKHLLVFQEGGKPESQGKKTLGASPEQGKN